MFEVKDIHARIDDKEILKGLSLTIGAGEVVAVMGPNGSGKSTLAHAIMGNPKFTVSGSIMLDGVEMLELSPDERAKKGIFLSFQHPSELPGVTMRSLLRSALVAREGRIMPAEFNSRLSSAMELIGMHPSFADRYVNEGFSGGEKKRAETLQLAMLRPKVAILDETDSGLDVDALKAVGAGIAACRTAENGFLVITHYKRILEFIKPDKVLVLKDGKIVRSGGPELAQEIEEGGFA